MAHGLRVEDSECCNTIIPFCFITTRRFADELKEVAITDSLIRLAAHEAMDSGDAIDKVSYRCFTGSVGEKPCVRIVWIWLLMVAESVAVELRVVVDEEYP